MPRSIAVALAALLLMLVAGPASAQAKRKRFEFVGPGGSIQAAVDAARPGDKILVKGVHRENVAITTNGISLRGLGAVLRPPATPAQNACVDPSDPSGSINGFCVLGEGNFDTGEVTREVRNVTVSGFRIRGFSASGIFAFGAHNATFEGNVAKDNAEYGLAAFSSTGTRFLFNRASGSGEAGIYVGDSPKADALLWGNETSDNLFGIFVRNALGGKAVLNASHDNCLGVLVLGDAPGPAGDFRFIANRVSNNTKACPGNEEEMSDPVSGVGFALSGATGVNILGNRITGNVPSGESLFSGGVVVAKGDGGTAPTDNRVRGNVILRNQTDLVWDESGTGNVFRRNLCRTSTPAGLCG